MNITRADFARYIKSFDFMGLFNHLGWDYCRSTLQPYVVSNVEYSFEIVADKSGFKVIVCSSNDGNIPTFSIRSRIDNYIKGILHEHILIFQNRNRTKQIWVYSFELNGKSKKSETEYNTTQDPERLYERAAGLIFDLDEEDKITIIDVSRRVNANFAINAEKVTKKFYDGFKKQHTNLLKFIKGIDTIGDKEWYASIMLNRLMFCYFMQKRGFLNKDRNYLRNKLNECKAKLGTNQFYSFYRNFLLVLFHKGFGSHAHTPDVVQMIGDIPYLNGGLFEVHEIETRCPNIAIDDRAFEEIFDLFDRYEWHLDSRDCASGNEISPDVLGYIFEKYINDRAQMGAYYTQEDITEYISRNSIIPYVFDTVQKKHPAAFEQDKEIWSLLRDRREDYIFESLKKGMDLPLPDYIQQGIDENAPNLLQRRERWNELAPQEYALPTEIWRDVIDRRKRCEDIRSKIAAGTINSIQDFITYNLDICAFAQDVVDTIEDPIFIYHFYGVISRMTILDPTCGSGAFLFAALNILEPLYSSCLSRMQDYINARIPLPKQVARAFEDELDNMSQHPNKRYYIFKAIILNNLYGVDIMKEATETAKLRLFLKLVSTANPNYTKENIGIEPLPDIDFNIKCGNSLVGYANDAEVDDALQGNMLSMLMAGEVREGLRQLAKATYRYKELQLRGGEDYASFKQSKAILKERRAKLNDILDKTLYEQNQEIIPIEEWVAKTSPFHWISEFYNIVSTEDGKAGFDVIIGNPPYVAMKKIDYLIHADIQSPDLYGYVINRSLQLIHETGMHSFIVMHNIAFSGQYRDLRKLFYSKARYGYFSFYARIPSGLFAGDVRVRNCIYILKKDSSALTHNFFTTRMHRWFSEAREYLFYKLSYLEFEAGEEIPMYASIQEKELFSVLRNQEQIRFDVSKYGSATLYFKQNAYNWVSVTKTPAPCYNKEGVEIEQSQVKPLSFRSTEKLGLYSLLYNGKMYFAFWLTYGDEFHVTKDDILSMGYPISQLSSDDLNQLDRIYLEFDRQLPSTIQFKLNAGKNVGTYNMSKLWDLTTESDLILLGKVCDHPELCYDAIIQHVKCTVISQNVDIEEEE